MLSRLVFAAVLLACAFALRAEQAYYQIDVVAFGPRDFPGPSGCQGRHDRLSSLSRRRPDEHAPVRVQDGHADHPPGAPRPPARRAVDPDRQPRAFQGSSQAGTSSASTVATKNAQPAGVGTGLLRERRAGASTQGMPNSANDNQIGRTWAARPGNAVAILARRAAHESEPDRRSESAYAVRARLRAEGAAGRSECCPSQSPDRADVIIFSSLREGANRADFDHGRVASGRLFRLRGNGLLPRRARALRQPRGDWSPRHQRSSAPDPRIPRRQADEPPQVRRQERLPHHGPGSGEARPKETSSRSATWRCRVAARRAVRSAPKGARRVAGPRIVPTSDGMAVTTGAAPAALPESSGPRTALAITTVARPN